MTGNREQKPSIWNRAFISIWIVGFIMSMGQYMMHALIPKYVDQLGLSAAVVGTIISVFAISAIGIRPLAGPAMDCFNNGRLLAAAISVVTIAFLCYGFAENIVMLIVARLLHGIGIGVAVPLCLVIVSKTLPNEKIATGIGIYAVGNALATAIGPFVGLKLVEAIGYSPAFFIIAFIFAMSFIFAICLKTEISQNSKFVISFEKIIVPEIVIPMLIMIFLSMAYSCINAFIILYGEMRGVADIGLFFTAYAIGLIISRPIGGKMADRFGVDKTLVPGCIIFALSYLLISCSKSLVSFLLVGFIFAFGYGICFPSIQTLSMLLVSPEKRGAASNMIFLGVDLGLLIGPSVAGVIITGVYNKSAVELDGYIVMYRFMILPIIFALALFIFKKKKIFNQLKNLN